jgi:hypothetical protein
MMEPKRIRLAGHVAGVGVKVNTYRILWESQKERDHYEDQDVGGWVDIKMDLREIGWSGMDWIDLAQDRDQWMAVVNTVMKLRVP